MSTTGYTGTHLWLVDLSKGKSLYIATVTKSEDAKKLRAAIECIRGFSTRNSVNAHRLIEAVLSTAVIGKGE